MNVDIYHDNLLISLDRYCGKVTLQDALRRTIERTSSVSERKRRNQVQKSLDKYRNIRLP